MPLKYFDVGATKYMVFFFGNKSRSIRTDSNSLCVFLLGAAPPRRRSLKLRNNIFILNTRLCESLLSGLRKREMRHGSSTSSAYFSTREGRRGQEACKKVALSWRIHDILPNPKVAIAWRKPCPPCSCRIERSLSHKG